MTEEREMKKKIDNLSWDINEFMRGRDGYTAVVDVIGIFRIQSPIGVTVTVQDGEILDYDKTPLVIQINLVRGTIRLDRYGNIDIMYRR